MLDRLWQTFTHDIAIDLGTANTLVAVRGFGLVINEPSVVAMNTKTHQILAVGIEAKQMIGRAPNNVSVIRPLKDGVITDFDTAQAIIRYFVQKVFLKYGKVFKLNRPRVVIGVPSLITDVEVRAVIDAAKSAGARKVYVVEEPIAAAIGSNILIEDATGAMIVDIGGGTTDIVVLSMGGKVVDNTIKIAGDEMDQAIVEYLKHKYNLLVGEKMAEELKIKIGSAIVAKKEESYEISGRDLLNGLPKTVNVSSLEVREALEETLNRITDAAREALEKTPPEILSDLVRTGVIITGGGSQIKGLDQFLAAKLKLPVHLGEKPAEAVVNGIYKLLDNIDLLDKVQVKDNLFE